jgi:hypothetical protein
MQFPSDINAELLIAGKRSGIALAITSRVGIADGMPLEDMMTEAHAHERDHKMSIVDAPRLAYIFKNASPEIIETLRKDKICTNSAKYIVRDYAGDLKLVVTHSDGPLVDSDSSKNMISRNKSYKFSKLEPADLLHLNSPIQEIHFEDLLYNFKNAAKPKEFTVYANIKRDALMRFNNPFLTYDQWMRDDIIMMTMGGEEERTIMAEQLFKKEDRTFIRNDSLDFNLINKPCGGFVVLGPQEYGLYTLAHKLDKGRIVLAKKEIILKCPGVKLEQYVLQKSLEQ